MRMPTSIWDRNVEDDCAKEEQGGGDRESLCALCYRNRAMHMSWNVALNTLDWVRMALYESIRQWKDLCVKVRENAVEQIAYL